MLVSAILVAAAELKPITSVPCLRSCRLRGVSSLLAQRNMETGAAIWRCTQSLGSEPGIDHRSSLSCTVFNVVKCINPDRHTVGPAVTTGRSCNLLPVVPSVRLCQNPTAGVSPKAMLT